MARGEVSASVSTTRTTKKRGRKTTATKSATTAGTHAKAFDLLDGVPIREIDHVEGITLGFRQEMLSLRDEDGTGGGVSTGAGVGNDHIIVQWGERQAFIRGSELLKAFVRKVAPEDVERFPDEIKG